MLKTQDPVTTSPDAAKGSKTSLPHRSNEKAAAKANFNVTDPSIGIARARDTDRWQFNGESPPQPGSLDDFNFNSNIPVDMGNVGSNFTWEIINLGLEEPLPPQETIDELYGQARSLLVCLIYATAGLPTNQILPFQTPDLFREDPPLTAHDTQV